MLDNPNLGEGEKDRKYLSDHNNPKKKLPYKFLDRE